MTIELQLHSLAGGELAPALEQSRAQGADLIDLRLRHRYIGDRHTSRLVIQGDLRREIVGVSALAGRALEIEHADDHLGELGLRKNLPPVLGFSEIADVPALGEQSEERTIEAEHALDAVVRQVVQREEASQLSVLSLPRDRAVGARAAQ